MKAYFSATLTNDLKVKNRYKLIIDSLKLLGVEVFQYGSDKINPHELINRTDEEITSVHKELDRYLKDSDLYIAEISEPSVGIGYEISQAITQRKPVLALNYEESNFQPLATIQGLKSKYIIYRKYNEKDIKEILTKFVKNSKKIVDTKFILIISPEIDKYLEWAADFKRMHKAQIVRNSLEKEMENDIDYKKAQGIKVGKSL